MADPRVHTSGERLVATLLLVALALGGAGLLLALGYDTDPARAHDVLARSAGGFYGWTRGFHSWMASFAFALTTVWVARAALLAGRWPSLPVWWVRLGAAAAVVGSMATGGTLIWDQRGWESLRHTAHAFWIPPPTSPSDAPLRLVFFTHVIALPAAAGALLVALAWALGRAGWKPPTPRELWRRGAPGALALVALAAALAPIATSPIGPPPSATGPHLKPAWPFLWLVPFEATWGTAGLRVAILLALSVAVALPWLLAALPATRRTAALAGLAVAWALLTVTGIAV